MSDPTDLQPMFVCFQSALQGLYARMEQRLQCELQRRDAEYESWRCNMEQMFEQKIQKGRHVGPRISVGCQTHAEETGFSEHSDYGKSSFAKSTVDRSSDNVSFNEWGEAIERCIVVCADLKEQSSETTDDVAMDKSTPLEQSNEPQLDESHSKADNCDSPAERPANAPGTEDSGSNHMTEENFKIDTLMKNSVILSFPAVESDEEVKPVRRGSGRKPSVLKKFCRICKKHFGKSYFKQHMISHTGEKPHKCGSCGKAFTRRRTLIIHLHTSHSVEERDELSRRAMRSVIVCNFCQQSFTDHRELALHLRTHASVNEDFNGAAMKAISGQMARVNGKESNNQEAEHSDAASVEVPSDGELSKPSSTPASDRSSPLPQLVSSSYRADGVLPSKRKDSEEFYCAVCRTRIKRRENFDRHMRAHSDDRLFQCNYCEKRFSARSLQRHLLSHRRDPKPKSKAASLPKIIICNICHRPFYNQDDFEAHVRTHNGAIVFPCGICHQVFPLRAMLDTHIMTHQDANLACGVCGKRFQNASNLETHAKSHR